MTNIETLHSIDISQLKEGADDVLRRVSENGESLDVTDGRRIVARLVPADANAAPLTAEMRRAILERHRQLAEDISRAWTDDISAVDTVSEGRRSL